MLIPEHFAISGSDGLHRIIRSHPLGALVTPTAGGLDVNHIPFDFDPLGKNLGVLTGHVARVNPVWEFCKGADHEVLVIFRGNEGYISPSWYPAKQETHRFVPTWNYEVVHARGRLTVRDDEKFLRGLLARLTRRHESQEVKPWKMGDSAPEFIDAMIKAIVGIEISITGLEGMSKLSQNREQRDFKGAVDALRGHGRHQLAEAMENTSKT